MSDERIDPDVVEAGARALYRRALTKATFFREFEEQAEGWEADAEVAIRAADRARGMKEEKRHPAIPVPGSGTARPGPATHYRLVSNWRPVEEAQGV
jgi:hypothetical protein